jgi:hypothetical protein
VFLIPFKPRSACIDWELAQADLRRTVRSVQHDLRDPTLIVVACHDEPDLADCQSGAEVQRVSFPRRRTIDSKEDATGRGSGGSLRLGCARQWVATATSCSSMPTTSFTATYPRTDSNERGSHLADAGYTLDASSCLLWRVRSGFGRICGSSFICAFRDDELRSAWDDDSAPFAQFGASPEQQGHHGYACLAADLAGRRCGCRSRASSPLRTTPRAGGASARGDSGPPRPVTSSGRDAA